MTSGDTEPSSAADESVITRRVGAVAVVTLNRERRRNGVTIEMCEQLHLRLSEIASSDAKVVVIRGSGNDFSVGADLTEDSAARGPSTLERLGHTYHASTLLHSMPQVTIAAIDGACAGAAMGWACACDFRFASTRARFKTAFLDVGVSGDMGLAWSLIRIVGGARARELLLFPEKISAEAAHDLDLVTRLFAPESLHDRVMGLAEELAARHSFPLRMMKANLISAETADMPSYVDIESARHLHTATGPSLVAGIESFRRRSTPSP